MLLGFAVNRAIKVASYERTRASVAKAFVTGDVSGTGGGMESEGSTFLQLREAAVGVSDEEKKLRDKLLNDAFIVQQFEMNDVTGEDLIAMVDSMSEAAMQAMVSLLDEFKKVENREVNDKERRAKKSSLVVFISAVVNDYNAMENASQQQEVGGEEGEEDGRE